MKKGAFRRTFLHKNRKSESSVRAKKDCKSQKVSKREVFGVNKGQNGSKMVKKGGF